MITYFLCVCVCVYVLHLNHLSIYFNHFTVVSEWFNFVKHLGFKKCSIKGLLGYYLDYIIIIIIIIHGAQRNLILTHYEQISK